MADKEKPAPKPEAAKFVRCRIRPGGRFDGQTYPAIVEVDPRDLKRLPHVLVSLSDEPREQERAEAAKATTSELTEGQRIYHSFRQGYIRAAEAEKQSRAIQERRRLEAMGIALAPTAG